MKQFADHSTRFYFLVFYSAFSMVLFFSQSLFAQRIKTEKKHDISAQYSPQILNTTASVCTVGVTVAGGNGQGSAANQLDFPTGIHVDAAGNMYIVDYANNRVQKWAPGANNGVTVAGGNGPGFAANQLNAPTGVFVDAMGNVYVADQDNHRIQKWAPGASSGITVAGGNGSGSVPNRLCYPRNVYVDANDNVFIADRANSRIQKWAPGATSGTTVAGMGGQGNAADQLHFPLDVFVDGLGNIFVADGWNRRIQKWAPGASSGTTVAGGNGSGSGAHQFAWTYAINIDASGNMFIADYPNRRVQKWAYGSTSGVTVAGGHGYGSAPNQISPSDIYVASSGDIYVVDYPNHRIQKWCQPGIPCTDPLSGVNALTLDSTRAAICWDSRPNAGFFKIQYRVKGTSSWTLKNIPNTDYQRNYWMLSGLTKNTKYQYRVRQQCPNLAAGPYSSIKEFTTFSTSPCAIPEESSIGKTSNPSAVVLMIDYEPSATKYNVRWRKLGSTGPLSSKIFKKGRVQISGLDPDTEYQYRVRTQCGTSWTAYSAWKNFITNPLTTPAPFREMVPDYVKSKVADVLVYPNPAKEKLFLNFSNTEIPVLLKLYDTRGNMMYERRPNKALENIDLSGLPVGQYFIQYIHSNGEQHSSTFVKG